MKPSDSIMQIFSQIRGKDDSEKAEELVRAVMIYLDEQAESKEHKALEEISPSEALYGFAGWLTSSDISLTVGAKHEAGEMAVLVDKFCKSQGLASPRDVYPNNLKPYPVAKPQEEPKKCECKEMSCEADCSRNHTHKEFWCETCQPGRTEEVYGQKETEPKKCWCGHTDGHVLNTNVPFIKSQE